MIQLTSHSGLVLDAIAFGTYKVPPGDTTYSLVSKAIELGYRSIDTAKFYENEQDVGRAVKNSGLDIHITTKVWNDEQGYQKSLDAGRRSRDYLQVESIDLLLVHWPGKGGSLMLETWRAFEQLREEGTVKYIGVSNFNVSHLQTLEQEGYSRPSANQIELHPFLSQQVVRDYCAENEIIVEAWAPLVGGNFSSLAPHLESIAQNHNKTAAQVALRWGVQHGLRILPKSANHTRMQENIEIFDFVLSNEEMQFIDGLNQNKRKGPDPEQFLF